MKYFFNYYDQTSSLVSVFNFSLRHPSFDFGVKKKKEDSRNENSHVLQRSLKLAANLFPFG